MNGILDDEPSAVSLDCPTADRRRLTVVTGLGEVEIVAELASIVNVTSFVLGPPGSVCG